MTEEHLVVLGVPQDALGQTAPKKAKMANQPFVLDYQRNVAKYAPTIRKGDSTLAAKFSALGLTPIETKSQDSNTHPFAAGVRSVATARALGMLHKVGIRHTFSMFSAVRDDSINLTLNKCERDVLGNAACDADALGKDPEMMSLDLVRPIVTPADIARASPIHTLQQLPAGDLSRKGFLYVDCYHLTPPDVANVLNRGQHNWAVWVGHQFHGDAGVCEEGGWVRLPSGRILFRSDPSSPAYTPHPDMSWLSGCSYKLPDNRYLVWTFKETLGSFSTYLFRIVDDALETGPLLPPAPMVKEIPVKISKLPEPFRGNKTRTAYWWACVRVWLWNFFASIIPYSHWWIPETRMRVQVDLFDRLRATLALRSRTSMSLKQLSSKTRDFLELDPKWSQLYRLFPSEFGGMVHATALAVFYHEIDAEASLLRTFQQTNVRALTDYNLYLNNPDLPPASGLATEYQSFAMILLVLAMVFVGFYIQQPGSHTELYLVPTYRMMFEQCREKVVGFLSAAWAFVYKHLKMFFLSSVFAPAVEETFKRVSYHPLWKLVSSVLCGYFDVAAFPVFPLGIFIVMVSLHLTWSILPMHFAMLAHAAYNFGGLFAFFTPPPGHGFAELMFINAYHVPWVAKLMVDTLEVWVSSYDSRLARQPRVITAHCAPKPKDVHVKVKGDWVVEPEDTPARSHIWWLLPTTVLGYAPARTDAQLFTVIEERIMVAPPGDPDSQSDAWDIVQMDGMRWGVTPYRKSPFLPIVRENELVQAWFQHFDDGKHKLRYRRALEVLDKEGIDVALRAARYTKVFVKTDELLIKYDYIDNYAVHGFKPRAIAEVHELIQAYIGPEVYEATNRFKKHCAWDSEPEVVKLEDRIVKIYLFAASGATDLILSQWFTRMTESVVMHSFDQIWIAAAGDDSVVVIKIDGLITKIEGDFGMFDQSQGLGPLGSQMHWEEFLGVSKETCDTLIVTHSSPFVIESRDKTHRMHITVRAMRRTGGADTTQGNSIVTLDSNRWVCLTIWEKRLPISQYQPLMKQLGFDLKIRERAHFGQLTFLKGMWVQVLEADFPLMWWWMPLPSRVLKMGKSLRDPRELYRLPLEEAALRFLQEQAAAYKPFLVCGPLAQFVKNFYNPVLPPRLLDPHKVQASNARLPKAFDDTPILEHYQTTREEWEYVCRQLPKRPFVMVAHPVYWRMARIDYG